MITLNVNVLNSININGRDENISMKKISNKEEIYNKIKINTTENKLA